MNEELERVAREDGRFSPQMVAFVYESLGKIAGGKKNKANHVTGRQFCEGLKKLALKKWGRLAMLTLNSGGVRTTRDFGHIVYLLIEHKWMKAQPSDSIEDFNDVYDFQKAFKDDFAF
jgi:uncharacterized repeat protein (TIGR04138 family)